MAVCVMPKKPLKITGKIIPAPGIQLTTRPSRFIREPKQSPAVRSLISSRPMMPSIRKLWCLIQLKVSRLTMKPGQVMLNQSPTTHLLPIVIRLVMGILIEAIQPLTEPATQLRNRVNGPLREQAWFLYPTAINSIQKLLTLAITNI